MTISRTLILSGIALLSAGWLMADPVLPDGHLGLKNGGCCSTDVFGEGPVVFAPGDGIVNATGGGTFVLDNQTGFVIKKFEVTIEFTDFAQTFACSSALFLFCDISGSGNPSTPHGFVTFTFHGIGTGDSANNSCAPDNTFECLDGGGASDDDPAGINGFGEFILDLNNPCDTICDPVGGFAPGTQITASVPPGGLGDPIATPEPATFALLLGAGGVLVAARRKFRRQ